MNTTYTTAEDVEFDGYCPRCWAHDGTLQRTYNTDEYDVLVLVDRFCPVNECRWTEGEEL